MALNFNQDVYPSNVITKFATSIQAIDSQISVKKRRIKTTDHSVSVGIFGDSWSPNSNSHEMRGGGFMGIHEPTLNRYSVIIQGLILDTEEERGLLKHYVLANALRTTLAWDGPLGVSLSQTTSVITNGYQEDLRKWSASEQRYYTADLGSSKWAYMSIMKFTLETETRRVA